MPVSRILFASLKKIFMSFCYFPAELSTIICNDDKVSLLLEHAHSCRGLKNLVKIGTQVTQEESSRAEGLGLRLISLADLEVSLGGWIPFFQIDQKQVRYVTTFAIFFFIFYATTATAQASHCNVHHTRQI